MTRTRFGMGLTLAALAEVLNTPFYAAGSYLPSDTIGGDIANAKHVPTRRYMARMRRAALNRGRRPKARHG